MSEIKKETGLDILLGILEDAHNSERWRGVEEDGDEVAFSIHRPIEVIQELFVFMDKMVEEGLFVHYFDRLEHPNDHAYSSMSPPIDHSPDSIISFHEYYMAANLEYDNPDTRSDLHCFYGKLENNIPNQNLCSRLVLYYDGMKVCIFDSTRDEYKGRIFVSGLYTETAILCTESSYVKEKGKHVTRKDME